ncbi:MAG: DUF5615 family PIN-like protein [Bacteroidota bacterium]
MKFLVDANLPKYSSFFNSEKFIHVTDINPCMTDTEIWNYAIEKELVILTKDTDFFSRAILSENPPKIVYFQLGNQTIKELHFYFENFWIEIEKHLQNSFLIIAKPDTINVLL